MLCRLSFFLGPSPKRLSATSPLGKKGFECTYCGKILHNQGKFLPVGMSVSKSIPNLKKRTAISCSTFIVLYDFLSFFFLFLWKALKFLL